MSGAMLTLDGLTIQHEQRAIIEALSLTVASGELVALMGASGSGKTTLLRVIAGLDPFAAGAIEIAGVHLHANGLPRGETLRELHNRVGMVFQFHNLFSNMTALQNMCLAPVHVHGKGRPEAEMRARALLESLGVGHRSEAFPHEMSGGEAQRVAIARALAVDPPLLLMDEPTASLDAARRMELAATLTSLVAQGRTLVIATHDADFARACARRVVLLEQGRIVRDGSPSTVF